MGEQQKFRIAKGSVAFLKGTDFMWNRAWESSSLITLSKTTEILVVSNLEEIIATS